ncbi:MAG: hypothetical protein IJO33_03140 [Bacilli bacterium]|nr:hypothetical protein [Bacilli bacterium]
MLIFKYNRIKTRSIFLYDKDGNHYGIAEMNINTKNSKEVLNEILQTIISKKDKKATEEDINLHIDI